MCQIIINAGCEVKHLFVKCIESYYGKHLWSFMNCLTQEAAFGFHSDDSELMYTVQDEMVGEC